jgi:hypothetical protein
MGNRIGRNGHLLGYGFGLNDPVKSDGFVRVSEETGRSG